MEVRKLRPEDRPAFISFATQFYSTDSVANPIPEKNMQDAFDEMIADSPYLDGFFILEKGRPAGYAILNYTYSMEFGGRVAMLDELFILPDYQGEGLGGAFLQYMREHLSEGLRAFRLEFVPDKKHLQRLYEKSGFKMMKYSSMVQELD